jgi:MSHA biogenesis protein MshQ
LISTDTSMQSLTGFSNSIQPTLSSPKKFNVAGNYVWRVPYNVTRICVEIWGGGGGGGTASTGSTPGGGGGGGAYGYQCFNVTPLSLINIVIGQGGNTNQDGGNSSFGNLLTATGGKKGQEVWSTYTGLGGAGGTCNAYYSYSGYSGSNGISMAGFSKGGNSGDNSGLGGYTSTSNSIDGISPGGAGAGSTLISFTGKGADGQVIIYW